MIVSIIFNNKIHSRTTRQSNLLRYPRSRVRTEVAKTESFCYHGCIVFNNFSSFTLDSYHFLSLFNSSMYGNVFSIVYSIFYCKIICNFISVVIYIYIYIYIYMVVDVSSGLPLIEGCHT